MVSDLRTGYLLGASHRAQFYGQVCGSFVAVWLSVGLFLLFTGAYPCILDASIDDCSFSTPALGAWVCWQVNHFLDPLLTRLSGRRSRSYYSLQSPDSAHKWVFGHCFWHACYTRSLCPLSYLPCTMASLCTQSVGFRIGIHGSDNSILNRYGCRSSRSIHLETAVAKFVCAKWICGPGWSDCGRRDWWAHSGVTGDYRSWWQCLWDWRRVCVGCLLWLMNTSPASARPSKS